MSKSVKKPLIFMCVFLVLIFVFMAVASGIQSDFGKVDVKLIGIDAGSIGEITAKLYTPASATAATPAPAVLLLHGYQNDKDTCGAYAIELARRGYVVLAIDEYGHGYTDAGMLERGYVNHIIKVNFGEDSEADGTYASVSGAERYKIMLNFSNLSFFNDHYSKDADGNSIKDSSMGGVAAYAALAGYDFVDETKMAVGGHSMGTWASWSVAAAYANAADNATGADISPKAVVLQCGEIFTEDVYDSQNIKFNNVLILQAKFEEFACFRDFRNVVAEDLPKSSLRSGFLGVAPASAAWNTTFGSFADGTARRMELLGTNHRLVTTSPKGVSMAISWLDSALGNSSALALTDQVYILKDTLVFASLLLSMAAMISFMGLMLNVPFFKYAKQDVPDRPEKVKDGKTWWRGAIITVLIAGLTYPFMTQLGHGLLPLPEGVFRMTIGNGFLAWYLLLIIVMLVTTIRPWKKSKKTDAPLDYCDLGFAGPGKAEKFDWRLLGKSALLAVLMTAFVYVLVWVCQTLFLLDFRLVFPFLKAFTFERFLQFLVYVPVFALFFILNNSKIFAQMRQPSSNAPGFKGFISCWWKNAICMAGGVFLLCLIEYVPFFAGIGPGADLIFSPTFGGPFMSLLLVFFPQILVLSVMCTSIYRKTGNVFTSGISVGIISCWIITGGSAML